MELEDLMPKGHKVYLELEVNNASEATKLYKWLYRHEEHFGCKLECISPGNQSVSKEEIKTKLLNFIESEL